MKGHNYGQCMKCNRFHIHPKGMLNKTHTTKTKQKIGRTSLNHKVSTKTKEKIAKSCSGNKNHMWKGDNVKYGALHEWVRNHKPKPQLCERCNESPSYDCANISGQYNRDINDFEWLCRGCHMKEDGRLEHLRQIKIKGGNKYALNVSPV